MKKLFVILISALLVAPLGADDKADATKVVGSFYAAYITAINKSEDAAKVVKNSPQLSPAFKKAYAALQAKAWKENPELGLGYDPIICGQDYPDAGFAVSQITLKDTTGTAVASSKDKNFKVEIPVTLVKIDGKWLISGIDKLHGK